MLGRQPGSCVRTEELNDADFASRRRWRGSSWPIACQLLVELESERSELILYVRPNWTLALPLI